MVQLNYLTETVAPAASRAAFGPFMPRLELIPRTSLITAIFYRRDSDAMPLYDPPWRTFLRRLGR